MAKAKLKLIEATQSQIASGAKVEGQVIFTSDSKKIFWDVDDETRIEMGPSVPLTIGELKRMSQSS